MLLEMPKVKMQGFVKREETHKENVVKACTLLIQQCTERMENQLKNRDDFNSALKNNPMELVKATKEETHHFKANACDMAIATKVAKDLLNTKQGLHESLLDHACRFKNARDVMKTKNGGFLELEAAMQKSVGNFGIIKRIVSLSK